MFHSFILKKRGIIAEKYKISIKNFTWDFVEAPLVSNSLNGMCSTLHTQKNLTQNAFTALIQRFYGELIMAWHRIIKMKPKENFFFHFTIESYENLGLISTMKKEDGFLILDCFTTMESAGDFDRVIENVLKEMKKSNE